LAQDRKVCAVTFPATARCLRMNSADKPPGHRRRLAGRPAPIPEPVFSAIVGMSLGMALGIGLLSHPVTARAFSFVTSVALRQADWPQSLVDTLTSQGGQFSAY
jgi:hypothetical protein